MYEWCDIAGLCEFLQAVDRFPGESDRQVGRQVRRVCSDHDDRKEPPEHEQDATRNRFRIDGSSCKESQFLEVLVLKSRK